MNILLEQNLNRRLDTFLGWSHEIMLFFCEISPFFWRSDFFLERWKLKILKLFKKIRSHNKMTGSHFQKLPFLKVNSRQAVLGAYCHTMWNSTSPKKSRIYRKKVRSHKKKAWSSEIIPKNVSSLLWDWLFLVRSSPRGVVTVVTSTFGLLNDGFGTRKRLSPGKDSFVFCV